MRAGRIVLGGPAPPEAAPREPALTDPGLHGERLSVAWMLGAAALLAAAAVLAATIGPVAIAPHRVLAELADHLPGVSLRSGLTEREAAIVWQIRLPRVAMAALVGAMLSAAGGAYQGAFRNPLADPYLLGVAAGAGLGATIAIVAGLSASLKGAVPVAAFLGALGAVLLTYLLGVAGGADRSSPTGLVLAGVAIASFLTALQTYLQQRNVDTIREVYTWILGRIPTAGWGEVLALAPYVAASCAILVRTRRALDVLSVGDEEAASLGLAVRRVRLTVVIAASLGTAAAVAATGLIGFVGIIVPHTVRLLAGRSYRVIVPLSAVLGAAFLVLTDLAARMMIRPAELPIGVVTAFFGAPFFLVVLRGQRRGSW